MSALLAALVALTATAHQPETWTLSVDGRDRTALVYKPSRGDAPHPVVICFHGHGGTSRYAARAYRFQELWPEALVIYPQGLPTVTRRVDPEGKRPGWNMTRLTDNQDIDFFDKMLKRVGEDPGYRKEVFIMGHSNGGGFVYTLWAARPDVIAGVASANAGGARRVTKPLPAFIVIGEKDQLVDPKLQHSSLDALKRLLRSTPEEGRKVGDQVRAYSGQAPLATFIYDGDHTFRGDSVPWMVKFFQSLPKGL